MGGLRIKIDEFIPQSQPRGLDDLEFVVSFQYGERTLLKEVGEANLVLTGDAYQYLYTSLRSRGYNGFHNVEIQKSGNDGLFGKIYDGLIFVSASNFDLDKRYAEVDILDTGYNSYIKNNQGIETNFTIGKTKNGENMQTPSPTVVELINPPSNTIPALGLNVSTGTTREFYSVEDILDHFVKFMSDNELSFNTDYFTNLKNDENLGFGIIQGRNLRRGSLETQNNGTLSFSDVWGDLGRLFNLILSVDTSTGVPTVRAENLPFYQNEEIIIRKNAVAGIKRSFVQQLLYGKIETGSSQSIIDNSVGALNYLPPFDFGNDSYYLAGVSNLDSTLNVSAQFFITDSNIIEDVITNNNETYDEDFFLIAYNSNTNEALTEGSDIFNDANYYYNGELTNKAVVGRYKLQGAAVKMVGDPDGDFEGRKGSAETTDYNGAPFVGLPFAGVVRVLTGNFDNVIIDPSGAWSTTTNRYTAALDGIRNVRIQVDSTLNNDWSYTPPYDVFFPPSNQLHVYIVMVRFKRNGVYMNQPGVQFVPLGQPRDTVIVLDHQVGGLGNVPMIISENIMLQAADYLEVEIGIGVGSMNIKDKNYFSGGNRKILMTDIPMNLRQVQWDNSNLRLTGGLIDVLSSTSMVVSTQGVINGVPISEESQDGFFINRFEFEETMSSEEMRSFLNSPQKAINLQNQEHGLDLKAWAFNVSINAMTGKTKFELFNNINSL